MKSWLWVVVAALGLAMMATAYYRRPALDPNVAWGRGLIALGPALEPKTATPFPVIPVHLKPLETPGPVETIFHALEQAIPEMGASSHPRSGPSSSRCRLIKPASGPIPCVPGGCQSLAPMKSSPGRTRRQCRIWSLAATSLLSWGNSSPISCSFPAAI